MSKKTPFMPMWVNDWIGGTQLMSPAEEGLFLRLVLSQWQHGPLPTDEDRLRRLARVDREEWAELWPAVSDKFEAVDGCFVNAKCAEVMTRQEAYIDQKRRAGKASAKARSKGHKSNEEATEIERALNGRCNVRSNGEGNGEGNGTPNETGTSHTHTHTQINTKESIVPKPADDSAKQSLPRKKYPVGFEEWWKAYRRPDKGSKKAACNQWKSKKLEGREKELIAKAEQYAKSVDDPKFMKHAERFLSNELYENEYKPAGSTEKGTGVLSPELLSRMFPAGNVKSAYPTEGDSNV